MRTIDFGLARGCAVRVSAHECAGSDHRLVVFVVTLHGHQLRIGLWNMLRDRRPLGVVDELERLVDEHDLDAIALCEAHDYVPELRRVGPLAGWRVSTSSREPGQDETAIVTRADLPIEALSSPQMTKRGWRTTRGGTVPPKHSTSLRIDGWLWLYVGHRAPSVRWRRFAPVGPARRVLNTRQHARSELRYARRHRGPVLMLEDWNATPATRGRYSPHWVARKAGLRVVAPKIGTHR